MMLMDFLVFVAIGSFALAVVTWLCELLENEMEDSDGS